MFYAPWCPHCQQLEPIWEEIAASLRPRDNLFMGKADATKESFLFMRFQVRVYPTLILLSGLFLAFA